LVAQLGPQEYPIIVAPHNVAWARALLVDLTRPLLDDEATDVEEAAVEPFEALASPYTGVVATVSGKRWIARDESEHDEFKRFRD